MAGKAKVVLTDYVWESLDVEKSTLAGLAELVPLQTKKPEEFLPQARNQIPGLALLGPCCARAEGRLASARGDRAGRDVGVAVRVLTA